MTYYGGKDLAAAFRTVRENTIKIAEEIPENKYDFKPAPDCRSGRADAGAHRGQHRHFSLHIHTNKITDMKTVNFMELFQKFTAEETKPRTKAELDRVPEDPRATSSRRFSRACPNRSSPEQVTMPPGAPAGDEEPLRDADVARRSTRCTIAAS